MFANALIAVGFYCERKQLVTRPYGVKLAASRTIISLLNKPDAVHFPIETPLWFTKLRIFYMPQRVQ